MQAGQIKSKTTSLDWQRSTIQGLLLLAHWDISYASKEIGQTKRLAKGIANTSNQEEEMSDRLIDVKARLLALQSTRLNHVG